MLLALCSFTRRSPARPPSPSSLCSIQDRAYRKEKSGLSSERLLQCHFLHDEPYDLTGQVKIQGLPHTGTATCNVYRGTLSTEKGKIPVTVKPLRDGFKREWHVPTSQRLQHYLPIWANVTHPRVVPYLGWAIVDGRFAVITRHCKHGQVLSKKTREDIKIDRKSLVYSMAEGLEHLHSRRIVHGHLNPGNVLIGDDGKAMISDFSLDHLVWSAEILEDDDNLHETQYAAPETLAEGERTTRADVYAFACIALEILTGKQPFYDRQSGINVLTDKVRGDVPLRRLYSELHQDAPIWGLFEQCWDRNAQSRPSMKYVLKKLEEFGFDSGK